ncbi:hypothetical protein [Mycobacterium sp.]|uniref:hypothetical protein n=1 Tax=Mycobacterium sp. TaxID=1785 RepID=UPI002DA8704B|nr:hypothetical protein [Mycobacterium sp.]
MPAPSVMPTLSQIRAWDTEHLRQAATFWSNTADNWEYAFDRVAREMPLPGGLPWEGSAADAAQARAKADQLKVRGLADDLRGAANIARSAVDELELAKKQALHAIGEAQAEGFVVGEDLSVTDGQTSVSLEELAARQAQAELLAAEIRAKALALSRADQDAAARISSFGASLGTVSFREGPDFDGNENVIQAVDFRSTPIPEKPPWTSPNPPPGGWSDDPITRTAQKIAYGHAGVKHAAEFPGMSKDQIAAEVERILRTNSTNPGSLIVGRTADGAPALYDPKTNIIVIRDAGAADGGTVFKPRAGEAYLESKMPTRLPSIPPAELADTPFRAPPAEPPGSRGPRGGIPPMVGQPEIVIPPGGGESDLPVVDFDGVGGTPSRPGS